MDSILTQSRPAAREETVTAKKALASVPGERDTVGEQLVSLLASESFEANRYRILRHFIEETRATSGRVIGVTSPGAGEGKTTTAINLAGILSQSRETRVLLIDADLRLSDVAAQLGLRANGQAGLADVILDPRMALESVVRRRPPFNLSIITAGRRLAAPYEALRSPRLGELIEQARRAYDYVIVDTPPVVPVPDCRVISRWVDRFILVVAAHRTPRRFLEEALNAMNQDKIAGLVFNGVDPPRAGPYGYYPGYGVPKAR